MAINVASKYPGRSTAPSTAYPYGSAKDETSPGAGDGTPYELGRANDIFGMQQALLKSRGIVPSGNADAVRASQYLQAVVELASGAANHMIDTGAANAYVLGLPNADSQGASQLFEGLRVRFIAANTNTGASTVVYVSGSPVDLKSYAGNPLVAGEVVAGELIEAAYSVAATAFLVTKVSPVYNLTGTVISAKNGEIQYKTLTVNTTFTETLTNGQSVLIAIDDGTAYTITWPTTTWVKAGGGASAPTLATTGYTWIMLWKLGSTLFGCEVGKP